MKKVTLWQLMMALVAILMTACAGVEDDPGATKDPNPPSFVDDGTRANSTERIQAGSEIHVGLEGCSLRVNFLKPNLNLESGKYRVLVDVDDGGFSQPLTFKDMTLTLEKDGNPIASRTFDNMKDYRYRMGRYGRVTFKLSSKLSIGFEDPTRFSLPPQPGLTIAFDLESAIQCLIHKKTFVIVAPRVISAGDEHSLAVSSNTVLGWGDNEDAELSFDPDLTETKFSSPQDTGISHIVEVAAGGEHSLVLRSDGTVFSFGSDAHGQLGDGDETTVGIRHEPIMVEGVKHVLRIAAGNRYSVALTADGTVWTWGFNTDGQLGRIVQDNKGRVLDEVHTLEPVKGLDNIIDIAAGHSHNLALQSDGTVWAWGSNRHHQLGRGNMTASSHEVQQVQGLPHIVAIAAGNGHSLALSEDGTVHAWGNNSHGQAGQDPLQSELVRFGTPQSIDLPETFKGKFMAIAAGDKFSIAVREDGTVWAWGSNEFQVLGSDTPINGINNLSFQPVQIHTISGVVAVSAGTRHVLALDNQNQIWSWGQNDQGQLGDDRTSDFHVPTVVF